MAQPRVTHQPTQFPMRYRSGGKRNDRLALPLKLITRTKVPDEKVIERFGADFHERDELGGALATAIRLRADHPDRVSMAQLKTALHQGIDAVENAPPALRDLFAEVEDVPDWVDWDLINEGARAYSRLGQNAADVLQQLSLIGGYRFEGPPDLLLQTGGLSGDSTRRRLAETQKWTVSLTQPDSLKPPSQGKPAGEGWRLTVHVRAMHALVNASFEPRWDVERWGLPINQSDQGATLGLFDGAVIVGVRALGVRLTHKDANAIMHLWKYVGYLLGIDDYYLVDDEHDRHRLNYHGVLAQGGMSEAGPALTKAIVDAQLELRFRGWPGPLARLRARYEQERLLSMLTVLLGPRSMREFGLPLRPPWAFAYIFALNLARYHVIGRTAWGRRQLEAWGERVRQRVLDRYFLDEVEDVGELPR